MLIFLSKNGIKAHCVIYTAYFQPYGYAEVYECPFKTMFFL
jgi:hypothetical protein